MQLRVLSTPELGNRSYVVSDGSVSIVIDPQRDVDRLDALLEHDVTHVLETHVHNDYVTGGLELARRTGAAYGVNAADDVAFERLPLTDGEHLTPGTLSVRVLATPGHTPTHLSYLVHDLADPDGPSALFSGGSLLYGTVGRTDLVSPELTHALAAAQHASAHRIAQLDGSVELYPTHGFGSFCAGGGSSGAEASTIADERLSNVALATTSVEEFVDRLVAGFTEHPAYYAHMADLNRTGPAAVDLHSSLQPVSPDQVARLLASGTTVIDLRPADAFAVEHLAGTVSVNLGTQFATYVGWLAPWGRPLAVLGETRAQLEDARRQLSRIGIDRFSPAWGSVDSLAPPSVPRAGYPRASFKDLASGLAPGDVVLDVRRRDERGAGHLSGAWHIPVHEIELRHGELPEGSRVWVHCAGGFRAGTAASLLEAHGVDVVHVDDTFDHALELGLVED